MSSQSQKRQRLIVFNTHETTLTHPNELHLPFKQKGSTILFFIPILILGHILDGFVDKTHALVVTIELIWLLFLNIFSFNFVSAPNKSLRFTRFTRSYLNRLAVILTNHCQSFTSILLDLHCLKWSRFFLCSCLSPMIVHLRNVILLSTRVARMLLTPRSLGRRKDVKQLSIT